MYLPGLEMPRLVPFAQVSLPVSIPLPVHAFACTEHVSGVGVFPVSFALTSTGKSITFYALFVVFENHRENTRGLPKS